MPIDNFLILIIAIPVTQGFAKKKIETDISTGSINYLNYEKSSMYLKMKYPSDWINFSNLNTSGINFQAEDIWFQSPNQEADFRVKLRVPFYQNVIMIILLIITRKIEIRFMKQV